MVPNRRCRHAVRHVPLEPSRVDRGRAQLKDIGARLGPDRDRRGQQLAQLRHIHLHDLPGGRRRRHSPHCLDQAITWDRVARTDDERREQPPLLVGMQRHRPLRAHQLNRSQDPNLHDRPT